MKRFIKIFSCFLLSFFGFILIYLASAWVLSSITVNKNNSYTSEPITCYLLTNGVHTDLVLPAKNKIKNWKELFLPANTKSKNTNLDWLAIGWGDKGFYLQTPTWADLTFATAFKAVFGLGTTALHTTYYTSLKETEQCIKIKLSENQYKSLVQHIESSTELAKEKAIWIQTDAIYGSNDAFYEATGRYSLFRSCNSWANEGLKVCGEKAVYWTPFDWGIFQHYTKSDN